MFISDCSNFINFLFDSCVSNVLYISLLQNPDKAVKKGKVYTMEVVRNTPPSVDVTPTKTKAKEDTTPPKSSAKKEESSASKGTPSNTDDVSPDFLFSF